MWTRHKEFAAAPRPAEPERVACEFCGIVAAEDDVCHTAPVDTCERALSAHNRLLNAVANRIAALPAQQGAQVPQGERAWLVEWRFNGVQWLYLTGGSFNFTSDPNRALRFARREDAEAAMAWAREFDRRRGLRETGETAVTEHEWTSVVLPASPQAPAANWLKDVLRGLEQSHTGMRYGDDKRAGQTEYTRGFGDCLKALKQALAEASHAPAAISQELCSIIAASDKAHGIARDYVEGYTFEGDDGYYVPDESARTMFLDLVHGLLAEPEFVRAVHDWCAAAKNAVKE